MATIVRAKRDESTESVIRRFKRRVVIDNTLPLLREKEFYKKPALKRKEHKKELERRKYRDAHIAMREAKKPL